MLNKILYLKILVMSYINLFEIIIYIKDIVLDSFIILVILMIFAKSIFSHCHNSF